MGRMLRLDPAWGWHHVMNRGVARQPVFHLAQDGYEFESLLADGYARFGVEVHPYCLMTNHFHLLVRCPEGGLSSYMQVVSSAYTRCLNARLGRDGPIFRGRFRSLLADSERYLSCAGRYIHRNPIDRGPSIDLVEYRWSSLRHYCGGVAPPSWLHLSLADRHGGADWYRRFVEGDEHAPRSGPLDWAIAMAIAECDDSSIADRARIDRTVALIMLDLADRTTAMELEEFLAFPNPEARRKALGRARRRLAENRVIGDLARRALALAA